MPRTPGSYRTRNRLAALAAAVLPWVPAGVAAGGDARLAELARSAAAVAVPTGSAAEYEQAADAFRGLLGRLQAIDSLQLDDEDRLDRELIEVHLRTRLFEIEELELHRALPSIYLDLRVTDRLYLRPCVYPDELLRSAAGEIEALPARLASARRNLDRPATEWTELAMRSASYAAQLLREHVPRACVDDSGLEARLLAAADRAAAAVEEHRSWLEHELLPRSTRRPAWPPEVMERYLTGHERLRGYGLETLLEMARREADELALEMAELARRIHPAGDRETVWRRMQAEAPPWAGIQPMVEGYREIARRWLDGAGAAVLPTPAGSGLDTAAIWSPRLGPLGRSGAATLLPPPDAWPEADREAWRRSLSPYRTHLLVVHHWIGRGLLRDAEAGNDRPARTLYRSLIWEEAWPLYVETLLEDEGYFDDLPYLERLKTEMARRQLRMWRVQRTIAKLQLASGEIDLERAVELYAESFGMPRERARLELVLDSRSPVPPLELAGERLLADLREAYRKQRGAAYQPRELHERLLDLAGLPLPAVGARLLRALRDQRRQEADSGPTRPRARAGCRIRRW